MKCENCGFEIEDGKLYCPSCGYEIQLVPDFDIELEDEFESEKPPILIEINILKYKKLMVFLIVAILFIVGTSLSIWLSFHNSYEYQIQKGTTYSTSGQYEKSNQYLERAIELDSLDPKAYLLLADNYIALGYHMKAITVLHNVIDNGMELLAVYNTLITIYSSNEQYDEITDLLENCNDYTILQNFQDFLADPPDYSVDAGTYEEMVPLKLLGNGSGSIYYTLDGSIPTIDSELYVGPIFLENGVFRVRAIYVNQYGTISDISDQTYTINISKPYAPEVLVYTGVYHTPESIVITPSDDIKVYYTIDGGIPTLNSSQYTKPIPMLIGEHVYRFVAINEKGVSSEVIERSLSLSFSSTYSTNDAREIVDQHILKLISEGKSEYNTLSGTVASSCNSAVMANGNICYLVIEFYDDGFGTLYKTGTEYLVDANTGELSLATINTNNEYQSIAIEYQ